MLVLAGRRDVDCAPQLAYYTTYKSALSRLAAEQGLPPRLCDPRYFMECKLHETYFTVILPGNYCMYHLARYYEYIREDTTVSSPVKSFRV